MWCKMKVVFSDGCFCGEVLQVNHKDAGYDIGTSAPPIYEFNDLEVIGNIYQHPELLQP